MALNCRALVWREAMGKKKRLNDEEWTKTMMKKKKKKKKKPVGYVVILSLAHPTTS